jgi:crotonobetainyl-CoA:carnitine CoA-transferase CaiB-like acyl-CoA transferase
VRHPKLGEIRIVGQVVKLLRTPATMASATPELGEHTAEILQELGYSAEHTAGMRARRIV